MLTNIIQEIRHKVISNFKEAYLLSDEFKVILDAEREIQNIPPIHRELKRHGNYFVESDSPEYVERKQKYKKLIEEPSNNFKALLWSKNNYNSISISDAIAISGKLNSLLENVSKYLITETINQSDFVLTNVGRRSFGFNGRGSYHPKRYDIFSVLHEGEIYQYFKNADTKGIESIYADIFIISNKYFTRLSIGTDGVLERVEHILQRDIKKINVVKNNMLEIYFHGHFDSETLVLDDYNKALDLQKRLTNLRQSR